MGAGNLHRCQYLTEHNTGLDFAGLVVQVKSLPVKDILASLLGDMAVPEAAYQEGLSKHRPALQETYRRAFREHEVDVIAFPTTPMPAATIGEEDTVLVNGTAVPTFFTYIRNTSPGSVAGIPGLSLPAGMTKLDFRSASKSTDRKAAISKSWPSDWRSRRSCRSCPHRNSDHHEEPSWHSRYWRARAATSSVAPWGALPSALPLA